MGKWYIAAIWTVELKPEIECLCSFLDFHFLLSCVLHYCESLVVVLVVTFQECEHKKRDLIQIASN